MTGILLLGFLIGMSHALEADHLAAVGAMAAERNAASKKGLAYRGAVWGLGHMITLLVICAAVILFNVVLTEQRAAILEFAVGVMLVLLGLDVLRRMIKNRVHFHMHSHEGGKPHIHAHSHAHSTEPHTHDPHHHKHAVGFPLKALAIGLVHGAAGSAALLTLVVAATHDPLIALSYVALFGFGGIVGMGLLSFVVAWPLTAAEKHVKLLHRGLSIGAAAVALYIGISVMLDTAPVAFAGGG